MALESHAEGPGFESRWMPLFFLVLFYDYQEKHIRRNHLFLTNTVNVKIQIVHNNIKKYIKIFKNS